MFFKLNAAAPVGLDCVPVDVEVDINKGQTAFSIVGLADTAIQEAKDRIHSALKNSGFNYPFNFRIVINLAPADLHKEGPVYDLPMAVGLIAVSNELILELDDSLIVGELALDGSVRATNGVLPLAIFARKHGWTKLFVPKNNAAEAGLIDDITIYPVENLRVLMEHLTGVKLIEPYVKNTDASEKIITDYNLDMALVKGQEFAKRALEIAASGGHNILLSGPPGSGKTLLARTLPTILPPLTSDEILEVTKIYSIAGLLQSSLISVRPFRSPHHTASAAALVGGGKNPRPGEISLAHRGVLFLDEFPEFPRTVIEALRQPLEDGTITVARAKGSYAFPARFILVASQNPCPCGYHGDVEKECNCPPMQIMRYQKKISGPILDRIDLHIEVPRVSFDKLTSDTPGENSTQIRKRVADARAIQNQRFVADDIFTNSEMTPAHLKKYCQLDNQSLELLRSAITQMHLSARAYNRILKVARTIADLGASEKVALEHIAEALQYRSKVE